MNTTRYSNMNNEDCGQSQAYFSGRTAVAEDVHIVDPLAYYMKILALERMDDAGELGKRDDKVMRLLKKHRRIARRKRLIPFADDVDARLEGVSLRYPHARQAIDEIRNAISLARLESGYAHVPNLLLVGPPGSGKTTLIKSLANAIWGMNGAVHEIYFPSLAGGFEINGGDAQWESADAGKIAKIMAQSDLANVLFLADEIDKSSFDSHRYGAPTVALYQLLESHTSWRFADVGLDGLRIDCSACSWLLTANELERIPGPIVSRCHVVEVSYPSSAADIALVIASIWTDLREGSAWGHYFSASLSDHVVEKLSRMAPRAARHALQSAAGRAVMRVEATAMRREENALVEPYQILPCDISMSAGGCARGMGFVW